MSKSSAGGSWVVGIDPGLSGALALLRGDECIAIKDMPATDDGSKRAVNAALLADALVEFYGLAGHSRMLVVLERVSARPGQGVSSMFNFGRSFGMVEGVIGALELPVRHVTPAAWKRKARLIGKSKDESRRRALELFPEVSKALQRKKDCGRAEAILIGFFGGCDG